MNEIFVTNSTMPIVCDSNHFITRKGFVHPDRCLPFHVLLYIRQGIFYVTEDEIDYAIPEGSLIFLRSGLRHYGKHPIPGGSEWYFIHFYLPLATGLPEFRPTMQPLSLNAPQEYRRPLPKMLSGLSQSALEEHIMEIPLYYQSDHPQRGWELNNRTYQLLCRIARESSHASDTPSLADRICRYLSAHKNEPFSAEGLEANFFLSYKHMAAVFKREKGITMQQYHNSLRMQQAGYMLTSTLLSIGEIAEALGFADALYFSRCFHRFHGNSPTEYRASHYMEL